MYVASAGDGTLKRYAGADLSLLGVTELGDDADNVRLDPQTGQVVVGYGDGALALVDGATGTKNGDMRSRPTRSRSGSRPTAAGSLSTCRMRTRSPWSTGMPGSRSHAWKVDGRGNFPMALDEAGGRLLIVDRDPPELLVFDTGSGEAVARLAICGDADDVFLRREAPACLCQLRRGFP